jgi:hypothetical protein
VNQCISKIIKSQSRKEKEKKGNKPKKINQCSLAPVQVDLEVSDSDNEVVFQPIMVKRPAVKKILFGNSLIKNNPSVMRKQSKGHIRKPCYDQVLVQNLQKAANDRR